MTISPLIPNPRTVHAPDGAARARRTTAICDELAQPDVTETDRRDLVDDLVEANLAVARSIAARYRNRGASLEDLEQVAFLGLVKAAARFDASEGHDFLSYAVPTIRGEVRRHFRDACWAVRPPRRVQELQARISAAESDLTHELGETPTQVQLAERLGETREAVVEAMTADGCFAPTSLDTPVADGTSSLGDLLPVTGGRHGAVEARLVLGPLMRALPARDRHVLRLRFFEDRTQAEIAEAVGVTQSQVSRTLTRILGELRAGLTGPAPAA
ncbi:sigma-70 family RNA polymerase sigma factor [Nocardioides sediminis]|uniref:sigma-70 family RNA polymerase sigma factor n=1 Tax=Nocardioides sediminis TaxID=433648 RepID=UPI000D3259D6|nr:sigma-70 family RNA polymerase sigma factor [Nocardioides sediminis]